jgi:Asp-tRNA(Asn)/Glu-tRNA(Gln) amidotransferase A subunit family amidase
MAHPSRYDLQSVRLPRLAGWKLEAFVRLVENPATSGLLVRQMLETGGISTLRKMVVDEPPTYRPHAPCDGPIAQDGPFDLSSFLATMRVVPKGSGLPTIRDYATAYLSGAATPVQVAEKVIAAIAESDARPEPLRAIVACLKEDLMAQARASAQRFRDGRPLGVLDGVPVAVKEEFDLVPYPTTVGTRFMGRSPAREDATAVARLRAAGALLVGKSNMHEIGIGVTGVNPHHGATRNPHDPLHVSGGSSGGSAAAVAAGLCPVALGADGGGSIRIPSAFCGQVGLSPTYARVSAFGSAPLAWTVDHYGPIAGSAQDAAIAYAVMAGPDPKDPGTRRQPPVTLESFDDLDLRGLVLGIYRPWFEHASSAMVEGCTRLVEGLKAMGAQVREVELPELDAARIAHLVTIISEMASGVERHDGAHRRDFGLDVRVSLALARALTSRDYVQAQRIRTRAIAHVEGVLGQVDAIVTPTTGITAPRLRADALPDGESDLTTTLEIMRFSTLANLTGHPAISIPAGYDAGGLPVGLQAIGRYWHEHTLLRLAHAAEKLVERRAPRVGYRLLG